MSKITLTTKKTITNSLIPYEAENISPDIFANKTIEEIKHLSLWHGNKEKKLSDVFIFEVEDLSDITNENLEITLKGDLNRFKRIGEKMSAGKIIIQNSIGMHLGREMKGGEIIVRGNAHDFVGANMSGGLIHIYGNAGHYVGGSMRGNWRGMSGGKIIVEGDIRNECGIWMRNGVIEIKGNADMFLGMHMHRGIILVHGSVTERAGAEMTGGTIIILGKLEKNLPSFELIQEIPEVETKDLGKIKGPFLEFHGDFAERKQGMMFVRKKGNKHLIL